MLHHHHFPFNVVRYQVIHPLIKFTFPNGTENFVKYVLALVSRTIVINLIFIIGLSDCLQDYQTQPQSETTTSSPVFFNICDRVQVGIAIKLCQERA